MLITAEVFTNTLEYLYGSDNIDAWYAKNEKAIEECFDLIIAIIAIIQEED